MHISITWIYICIYIYVYEYINIYRISFCQRESRSRLSEVETVDLRIFWPTVEFHFRLNSIRMRRYTCIVFVYILVYYTHTYM